MTAPPSSPDLLAAQVRNTSLCKYLQGRYLIPALQRQRLKVTFPTESNDPLEWVFAPPKDFDALLLQCREFILHLEQHPAAFEQTTLITQSKNQQFDDGTNKFEAAVRVLAKLYQDGTIPLSDAYAEHMSSVFGFLSLANDFSVPLMWSHYADNHRGAVMIFGSRIGTGYRTKMDLDSTDPFPAMTVVGNVTYCSEVPSLNGFFNLDKYNTESELIDHMYKKMDHWSYEGEVRVLLEKSRLTQDPSLPSLYFTHFNPERLIGVIFGLRTPQTLIDEAASLLNKQYPHTFIYRARYGSGPAMRFERIK